MFARYHDRCALAHVVSALRCYEADAPVSCLVIPNSTVLIVLLFFSFRKFKL